MSEGADQFLDVSYVPVKLISLQVIVLLTIPLVNMSTGFPPLLFQFIELATLSFFETFHLAVMSFLKAFKLCLLNYF